MIEPNDSTTGHADRNRAGADTPQRGSPSTHPLRDPLASTRQCIAAVVLALITAAAVYMFIYDPAREGVYPICLFHKVTGWHCAGCGTARALHQLLHGHVLTALDLNPLLILALPLLAWIGIPCLIAWLHGKPSPSRRIGAVWVVWIVAIVLLYTIARNIPAWPFTILAP